MPKLAEKIQPSGEIGAELQRRLGERGEEWLAVLDLVPEQVRELVAVIDGMGANVGHGFTRWWDRERIPIIRSQILTWQGFDQSKVEQRKKLVAKGFVACFATIPNKGECPMG